MKRKFAIGLFCILLLPLLAGCCLSHDWQPATCEAPETCAKCGKTQGETLPHNWREATCEVSRTCTGCGVTEGDPLGHDWQEATCEAPETCTRCAKTQGEPLEHDIQDGVIQGETLVGTCANCGAELSEPIEWESFAPSLLEGKWKCVTMSCHGVEYDPPEEMYAEFNKDNTYSWWLIDQNLTGTWSFNEHDDKYQVVRFYLYDPEYKRLPGGAIFYDDKLSVLSIGVVVNDKFMKLTYERA